MPMKKDTEEWKDTWNNKRHEKTYSKEVEDKLKGTRQIQLEPYEAWSSRKQEPRLFSTFQDGKQKTGDLPVESMKSTEALLPESQM